MNQLLFRAEWIAPIDRAPMRDAAVVVEDGRIRRIGDAAALRRAYPRAREIDLGRSILLPGLVNPHTHLELSGLTADVVPGGDFGDWILSLRPRLNLTVENIEQVVTEAVRRGLEQCRRFGVTTIGDISQHNHITRPLLRKATVRCVSYGEVLGLAGHRKRYEDLLPRALDRTHEGKTLRIGLTPHAPYTVDLPGFTDCVRHAREQGLPLATHLAETPHEEDFLRRHQGLFRRVWEAVGQWADDVPRFDGGPIDFARTVGLLDQPALLAHVNYCDDRELEILAASPASVVYCPRTHQYFGHPPHRWRDMLKCGTNVAVGTDSCASSPDLNIVDELRLIRRLAPDLPASELWKLATVNAAKAVGMGDEVGSLTPAKAADFVTFNAVGPDPLEAILHDPLLPTTLWMSGERLGA